MIEDETLMDVSRKAFFSAPPKVQKITTPFELASLIKARWEVGGETICPYPDDRVHEQVVGG